MVVGIIGGGQLGQMLAISCKKRGFDVVCLDPTINCPASYVADKHIVANFNDYGMIEKLCKLSDVVTYEFENVPFRIVRDMEEKYNIPQGYRPLYYSQNRLREKEACLAAGLKTVPFAKVENKSDLLKGIEEIGLPAILKTVSFGYDGKGQVLIENISDIDKCSDLLEYKCILEGYLDFDAEISVVAVRNETGVALLPIPENEHVNKILKYSFLPNRQSELVNTLAASMTRAFMQKMDFTGILTIEYFVKGNDVYFNEMAPRPHNSGHYSIEGCEESQFDLHLRSIIGEKLEYPSLKQPTVMLNILGQHMKYLDELQEGNIHLYKKEVVKENRKMGHITFIDKTVEEIKEMTEHWVK